MNGKMSINLDKNKRFDQDRESLGELLDAAVAITDPHPHKHIGDSESNRKREAAWIVRWAVRAVAGEIIRTGKIPLPLKVRFVGASEDIPDWRRELGGGDYSLN